MKLIRTTGILLGAALLGVTAPALGQAKKAPAVAKRVAAKEAKVAKGEANPEGAKAEPGKEKAEAANEKGAEEAGEAEKGANPEEKGKAPEHAARHEALKKRMLKLKETRKARKAQRHTELKQKLGAKLLKQAPVKAALKVHARRLARLNRIKALAEESERENKDKILERIKKLIDKEQARHDKHMETLKSKGGAQ